MTPWMYDAVKILIAVMLVIINGFFVAAEFALVKVRIGRLDELVKSRRSFAITARWLAQRLEGSLSACQLGITMASLGLGWVGEPAVAHLIRPLLYSIGLVSEMVIHAVAFTVAFASITAAHLVLGEQAPKIAAIRKPETILLWCAAPLKAFYFLFYPLLSALSSATSILLRTVGIKGQTEHDIPLGEGEIRALVHHSHIHGELSRSEHRLISAVFDFDEMICRRVMVPRGEVVFLNSDSSTKDAIALVRKTKHSRYPVCEGSMDRVVGVVHVKDMIGLPVDGPSDLKSIMRPPQFVPETIPARRLLRQIQATHQHMAFAVDEYGSVTGIVTLENVLEPIIGSVEDEFDNEQPDILKEGPQQFMVAGNTSVEAVNRKLGLALDPSEVDTISGLLMAMTGKVPAKGDQITLPGALVEVIEVQDRRTVRVRMTLEDSPPEMV